MEKLGKQWILKFTPESLDFIISGQTGMQIWASLKTSTLFEDYLVQAVYENTIFLELCGAHLMRALKSGEKASEMSIKLAKKDLAVISLTIESQVFVFNLDADWKANRSNARRAGAHLETRNCYTGLS